jgi:L-ascorbate metabolism protein UlaG (beta-lactamase superfamily)
VGDVIGFTLIHDGRVVWISGDTVLYDGVRAMAGRWHIDVALLHLGGVRFPVTGPLRYTMTAREAIELVGLLTPGVVIPIHYEGWSHFKQGRAAIDAELATAPAGVRDRFRWVPIGEPVEL